MPTRSKLSLHPFLHLHSLCFDADILHSAFGSCEVGISSFVGVTCLLVQVEVSINNVYWLLLHKQWVSTSKAQNMGLLREPIT